MFAQQHFERGLSLYDAGDLAEALESFRRSYDLWASPNSLLYVARSLRRLERPAEAAAVYERTAYEAQLRAAERDLYATTARVASDELAALEPNIGRVVVRPAEVPEGGELRIAGRSLEPRAIGLPWPVTPGAVAVELIVRGRPRVARIVDVAAGQEVTVDLSPAPPPSAPAPTEREAEPEPEPEPEREPLPRAELPVERSGHAGGTALAALVTGGVAVAGWAGLTVFGLLGLDKRDELEATCGGPCPPERANDVDTARTYETAANVALAIGAAATVAAAVLLLIDVTAGDAAAAAAPSTAGLALRW